MVKEFFYNLFAARNHRSAEEQIRRLENRLPSARSRFAVPFIFRGWGHFKNIKPRQNPVEIERLFATICELNPDRVLEIGTARGGTLYLWAQAAMPSAVMVSVDLPGGDFGGAYPRCRIPFYRSFARGNQQIYLELADSHASETLELVKNRFEKKRLDFAFIDGDHTYEGVKEDFYTYGPLVRPGGIIAFHDILFRDSQPNIRVDRLWSELKVKYSCEEFIGPEGSGKKIGIGVLHVPSEGISG